jgi:hypothetical protein
MAERSGRAQHERVERPIRQDLLYLGRRSRNADGFGKLVFYPIEPAVEVTISKMNRPIVDLGDDE